MKAVQCVCVFLYHTIHWHYRVLCDGESQCYCISCYSIVEINFLACVLNVTHLFVVTLIFLYVNGTSLSIYIYAHVCITVALFFQYAIEGNHRRCYTVGCNSCQRHNISVCLLVKNVAMIIHNVLRMETFCG